MGGEISVRELIKSKSFCVILAVNFLKKRMSQVTNTEHPYNLWFVEQLVATNNCLGKLSIFCCNFLLCRTDSNVRSSDQFFNAKLCIMMKEFILHSMRILANTSKSKIVTLITLLECSLYNHLILEFQR